MKARAARARGVAASAARVRRPDAGAAFEAVAADTHRLSVLLGAGLDPMAALRALDAPSGPLVAASGCVTAHDVSEVIVASSRGLGAEQERAWALLAASWAVAIETGAPLAGTLERAADTLRSCADVERNVDLATAGPLATARVVALLPLGGLGIGVLLGADPVGVIVGTIPGAVAFVLGIAALLLGMRWNRRLIEAARARDPDAGVGAELLALALSGGSPPEHAVALVAAVAQSCGLTAAEDEARATLAFARRAGVPAAALLRADASRARRVALTDGLRRAALLGTKLLGPLAVCFLPAFVLLGVVPLIIGILRGVLAAF